MTQKDIRDSIISLLGNRCANPYNLKECSTKPFKGKNHYYMFQIDHINLNGYLDKNEF